MSHRTILAAWKCPLDTASDKVPVVDMASDKVPVVDTASVEAWEQLQLPPGKGMLFDCREMSRQKLLIRQSASLEGT